MTIEILNAVIKKSILDGEMAAEFPDGILSTTNLASEFHSKRKLTDAVAARVTASRLENLSECALTVVCLTQIIARIIEVRVIWEIGEAALEL